MNAAKQRGAWIWLAVAALAIAVAARAQSGVYSPRLCATPVIQFLAAHATGEPEAANALQRLLHARSVQAGQHGADSGAMATMLPVFFVGLVAPLNLVLPGSQNSIGRAPAPPPLPSSFQRPPPHLL